MNYQGASKIDPFRVAKLEPDKKGAVCADANRRVSRWKPILESLKMVGVPDETGQSHAIIFADKTLHQVRGWQLSRTELRADHRHHGDGGHIEGTRRRCER